MKAIFSILAAALALSACSGTSTPTSLPATNQLAARPSVHAKTAGDSNGVTANGIYTLYGCQIYGETGSPDPIVNADISNASVDPNSASLIALVKKTAISGGDDDAILYYPNVTTDDSHLAVPNPVSGGHPTVIFPNPWSTKFEFIGGQFWIENPNVSAGHDHAGGGDGHRGGTGFLNSQTAFVM